MSFWQTSDGKDTFEAGPNYEGTGSGNFILIPNGSTLGVYVKDAGREIDDKSGRECIFAVFSTMKPDEVKGFQIKKRFWVLDNNPDPNAVGADQEVKKMNAAKYMFGALAHVNNGKLKGIAKGVPTDLELKSGLIGGQCVIEMALMKPKDGSEPFNYVGKVLEKGRPIKMTGPAIPKENTKKEEKMIDDWNNAPAQGGGGFGDDDSDIPF